MSKRLKIFCLVMYAAAAILALSALSLGMNRAEDTAGLMQSGWPEQYADMISINKTKALWHAAVMAGLLGAFVQLLWKTAGKKTGSWKAFAFFAPVLLVAVDAVLISRPYVRTLPDGYIDENPVVSYLTSHIGLQRVATVTQDGFYNLWLTYTFPYYQIPAFNITQMPRMPQDYKQFLETVGRNPLRMWQLSAVGFLMGPSGFEKQLPAGQYAPVLRYDVLAGADGSLSVRTNEKGQQVIVQCTAPAPRFALIGGCEKMDDTTALKRLASSDWKPFDKIILPLDCPQPDPGGRGLYGKVDVLEYRQDRAVLKVQADQPGFLRIATKHDSGWKVQLDGSPATLLRADFIFQAVYIPAGDHEVILKYKPENRLLWVQFAGIGVCGVAVIWLLLTSRKKSA